MDAMRTGLRALLLALSVTACWPSTIMGQSADWQVFGLAEGLPSVSIWSIAQAEDGAIWVGTDWGLCIRSNDAWEVLQMSNSPLPDNHVTALASAGANGMWLGTMQGGLVHVQNGQWEQFTPGNSPMPDEQVNGLAVDGAGRIWIATPRGLAMKDGEEWRLYDDSEQSYNGFRFWGRHVSRVSARADGLIAATTMNGGYACFTETSFICYTSNQHSFPDNSGYGVAFDQAGDRWVATTTSGLVRHAGPFLDALWFRFSEETSAIPDNTVRAVVVDAQDRKILGMELHGLAIMDAQGNWSRITRSNSPLPDDQVRSLFLDRDGTLWIGTWEGGLASYRATVGIHPVAGNSAWSLFPNPAQDHLRIRGHAEGRPVQWRILDLAGRMLAHGTSWDGVISLDGLPVLQGTFLLIAEQAGERFQAAFVRG